MAKEWGANQFSIVNPLSVRSDDPTIFEVSTDQAGWYSFPTFDWDGFVKNGEGAWDHLNLSEIEQEYVIFKRRLEQFRADEFGQSKCIKYCDWLYKAVVIDANGRMLPCCYMPIVADEGRGTLGKWIQDADVGELYNSTEYQDMRINESRLTGCAYCGIKEGLIFDTSHIKRDFQYWSIYHDLSSEAIEALYDWKTEL